MYVGAGQFKGQAGETGAGADVNHPGVGLQGAAQGRQNGKGIEEVLDLHLTIIYDAGEVHSAVPVGQFTVVDLELPKLGGIQGQAQFGRAP